MFTSLLSALPKHSPWIVIHCVETDLRFLEQQCVNNLRSRHAIDKVKTVEYSTLCSEKNTLTFSFYVSMENV